MRRLLTLWTCGLAVLIQLSSPIAAQRKSMPMPMPPPGVPVRVGGSIQPPQRTRYVEPIYPEVAHAKGLSGVVIVEFVIGTTGRVRNVRVLRSAPPFDGPAVSAVRQWRYKPTFLGGTSVPVIITVSVQFRPPPIGSA